MLIQIFLILLVITILTSIVTAVIINKNKNSTGKLNTNERVAINRYYSYAKTVLEGGVIPSLSCVNCYGGGPLNGQAFTTIGNPEMDNGSPIYQIDYGPWKGQTFVDFDSSSGLMCGNSWGQPSKQAEIIYNILSLSAPNPVIQNKYVHRKFVKELYYNGTEPPKWKDWQGSHVIQPPKCYKSTQYFMNGNVYLGGFMGLRYNFCQEYICWGHFGETYGYTSLSQFFPKTITNNFYGLLKNLDVVFVLAQNTDTQTQTALNNALNLLCYQLTNSSQFSINTEKDLQNAISKAIYWAYCSNTAGGTACSEPIKNYTNLNGLTMTIGYYFIDNGNTTYQNSVTMSVINKVIKQPTYDYPFNHEFLGADGGREPAYYYGSGTKPITTFLVTNAICKAWFNNNKKGTSEEFLEWYRGTGLDKNVYKTYKAITMKDILNLPNQSYYLETIEKYTKFKDEKNIGNPTFTVATNTIQKWYDIIFSNDNDLACSWRGLSQDTKRCPTNQCYEILDATGNPSSKPFETCSCITITKLNDIFYNNLSPIDLLNMNSGIPDADTVLTGTKGLIPSPNALQLDYIDQLIGRTQSIGSMNYIRELVGFNWIPGWSSHNKNIVPNTYGVDGQNLPGEYSSSGFTMLGSILWILDPHGEKTQSTAKNWTEIDINDSFLNSKLKTNNNYAGTSGNGGEKYFVDKDSMPQKNILPGCNVSNSKRIDCIGKSGVDKNTCLSNNNCCFQPSLVINNGKPIPWCFKKN